MRTRIAHVGAAMAVAVCLAIPYAGEASIQHPTVVNEQAVTYTPSLVPTTAVAKPHVDTIAQLGSTVYAGGLFGEVTNFNGTLSYTRNNLVAFSADTGVVADFNADFNGQVWAIEAAGSSIYVGGAFTTVNGESRPKLVKLDATTGLRDQAFNPKISTGQITEIAMVGPRLLIGGSSGKKLMALNPTTGKDTGYINLGIADAIPNAAGGVAVYRFAVNPAGTQLVATGNFRTVSGESRMRMFVADLGETQATLNSWYYPGFEKPCSSIQARRIAYLQGVDFSPDGSYFVVTATGQIPLFPADVWGGRFQSAEFTTVCDGVGRFDMANDQAPVWINYTGGDSIWTASATGSAVYVQGHFEWLDNPNGFASRCPLNQVCASRKGIGAIDPVTGQALPWDPPKPAQIGGKDFLVTPAGLWVGSDSTRFAGKPRRGIAFVPLP